MPWPPSSDLHELSKNPPHMQLLAWKASGFTEHLVDAIGQQGDPGSHR